MTEKEKEIEREKEKIQARKRITNRALILSEFFEVELTVKVFGKVIWHLLWPPKKSE